jgi:hypothetical protein
MAILKSTHLLELRMGERWSGDVSEDIADELAKLLAIEGRETPATLRGFLDRHNGGRPMQLPLPLRGAA